MNDSRITVLKRENIIWIIYVVFAVLGIKANNLEIEDEKNNNNKNQKKYKSINVFIIFISILIYIYFVWLTYNYLKSENKKGNRYTFIGSILVLIAGILFLIAELTDDIITPNEI